MSKNGIALAFVGILAAWHHTAHAQQPFFGPAYGAAYQSIHHHHHQPQVYYPQPSYGTYPAGYGYTPPVVLPVAPGYGGGYGGYGWCDGYGRYGNGGYGSGGYPNANYQLPAFPQPQYPILRSQATVTIITARRNPTTTNRILGIWDTFC